MIMIRKGLKVGGIYIFDLYIFDLYIFGPYLVSQYGNSHKYLFHEQFIYLYLIKHICNLRENTLLDLILELMHYVMLLSSRLRVGVIIYFGQK